MAVEFPSRAEREAKWRRDVGERIGRSRRREKVPPPDGRGRGGTRDFSGSGAGVSQTVDSRVKTISTRRQRRAFSYPGVPPRPLASPPHHHTNAHRESLGRSRLARKGSPPACVRLLALATPSPSSRRASRRRRPTRSTPSCSAAPSPRAPPSSATRPRAADRAPPRSSAAPGPSKVRDEREDRPRTRPSRRLSFARTGAPPPAGRAQMMDSKPLRRAMDSIPGGAARSNHRARANDPPFVPLPSPRVFAPRARRPPPPARASPLSLAPRLGADRRPSPPPPHARRRSVRRSATDYSLRPASSFPQVPPRLSPPARARAPPSASPRSPRSPTRPTPRTTSTGTRWVSASRRRRT
jgi:hypothetical protein